MGPLPRFCRLLVKGSFDRYRGRSSPEAVVVQSLFSAERHPAAYAFNLRRIVQLTVRAMASVIRDGEQTGVPTEGDAVILHTPVDPSLEAYVADLEAGSRVVSVDQAASPNRLSWLARLGGAAAIGTSALFVIPATVFLRSNSALKRLVEIARALRAVSFLHQLAPERVYCIGTVDRTANLLAHLLDEAKIKVIKVPSPNPLVYHYQTCVASEFFLTSPLQIPEYLHYRQAWFVPTVRLWRTLGHVTFPEVSYHQSGTQPGKTIGLLSGGQWWRYERGDLFDETRMFQLRAEEALHRALGRFLRRHPEVRLLVYPHPSEKRGAYERAQEVYAERIGAERVELLRADERTHSRFRDADTLVALWSTSALEAIYCGHKVLFAPLGCPPKHYEQALASIHAYDEASLSKKLAAVLEMTNEEYFEKNGMRAYRHDYYGNKPLLITEENRPVSTDYARQLASIDEQGAGDAGAFS